MAAGRTYGTAARPDADARGAMSEFAHPQTRGSAAAVASGKCRYAALRASRAGVRIRASGNAPLKAAEAVRIAPVDVTGDRGFGSSDRRSRPVRRIPPRLARDHAFAQTNETALSGTRGDQAEIETRRRQLAQRPLDTLSDKTEEIHRIVYDGRSPIRLITAEVLCGIACA